MKSIGLATFVLICTCSNLLAQSARAASRNPGLNASDRLTEIQILGSHRFQQADLVRATGLKLGDNGDEAKLKQAADRLASSGMFIDVTYQYIGTPQGTRAEFHVRDTEKLLPLHFENFVWLTADELLKRLHDREPLFIGQVPNVGEMYQKIADDTKAILDQLKIAAARVRVFPQVRPLGREVIGFNYLVDGVEMPIRTVIFEGDSAALEPFLQHAAATSLIRADYSESRVNAVAKYDLLPLYRTRGYLRAKFSAPSATLIDRDSGAVSVKLPVVEGAVYQLSGVQWEGNTAYPASEFEKVVKPEPGKPLNQVQFEENLRGISKIYGTKGYMEAKLDPEYVFDDPGQKVVVQVKVKEGPQYRMGIVRFEGLNDASVGFLKQKWTLHSGDVYDASYSGIFLTTVSREVDLTRLDIKMDQKLNRETKTVDLTLQFSPK